MQKFGKKIFEAHVADSLRKQGYTVTILHDPNVWLKEQAAKREQAAKEAAAAKAKAEQERFDAAVAAAVAKALAAKEKADADAQQEPAKKPGRPAKETKE